MFRVRNTHTAPVGIYDAKGRCVMVQPQESVEVDLTDGEAAATIRDNGYLKCERVRGQPAAATLPADSKAKPAADAAGKSGKGEKRGPAPAG